MRSLQILFVVGLAAQLLPAGQGSIALLTAQTTLISACIIGIFAVILRTPFFRGKGEKNGAMSDALAYASIWGSVAGIVALTWATQQKVVAVIVTVVFVFCLCVVAGCELHAVFGEPKEVK